MSSIKIKNKEYIPAQEAGKFFGYTGDYVARLARENKIDAKKVGRQWLVEKKSLASFVEAGVQEKRIRFEQLKAARKADLEHLKKVVPVGVTTLGLGALASMDSFELRLRAILMTAGTLLAGASFGVLLFVPPVNEVKQAIAYAQSFDIPSVERSFDTVENIAGIAYGGISERTSGVMRAAVALGITALIESDKNLANLFWNDVWCTTTSFFGFAVCENGSENTQVAYIEDGLPSSAQVVEPTRVVERVVTTLPSDTAPVYITNITNPVTIIREIGTLSEVIQNTYVTKKFDTIQTNAVFDSLDSLGDSVSENINNRFSDIGNAFTTNTLTVNGNTSVLGTLTVNEFTATSSSVIGTSTASKFVATSSTATSTFAGGLAIETSGFVYDYSTNNVGIGTASPNEKLSVAGSIYADVDITGSLITATSSVRAPFFTATSTTATSTFAGGLTLGTDGFVYDLSTKRVGIGTTSPSARLAVSGDIYAEGNLTVSGLTATTSISAPYFTATDASATSTFAGGLVVGTNGIVYDFSTDNVGIGDATPASLFTVGDGDLFQVTSSGLVLAPNGASGAGNLAFSFVSDTDTGLYRSASNEIRFQTGGSDRLTLDANGNFGIGTTSPAAQLGVTGDTYLDGDLTVTGNSFVFGDSTTDTITINSSINSSLIPDQNATYDVGSPSFFWDDAFFDTITANNISAASSTISGTQSSEFTINSDNASVDTETSSLIFFRGTVVPNAVITWNSDREYFDFNQPLFVQNDSSTTTVPTFALRTTSGQTAPALDVRDDSENPFLIVDVNGNVGIGTTSPSALLSVGGMNQFQVNSSGAIAAATGITSSGTINFSGLTASRALFTDASKNLVSTGVSENIADALSDETGSGALVFGTAPTLTALTVSSGGIGVTGNSTIAGTLSALTSITSSGTITFSGLSDGIIQSTNGVLSASSTISSTFIADDFLRNDGDDTTSGQLTATNFIANSASATSTFAGGLAIETSGFVYDYSTNNVGIGTASPVGLLHVQNGSSGQATPSSLFDDAVFESSFDAGISILTPNTRIGGIMFGDNNDANVGRITYSHGTNAFTIGVNDTDRFFINSLGYVGINDATPTYRLDVSGNAHFTSFVDASHFVATSTTATSTFAGGLTLGTDGFVYDLSTKRVGIGTTSPDSPLTVNGDVRFGEAANYDGFFYDATNARLGLGTGSPDSSLYVKSKTGESPVITLDSTDVDAFNSDAKIEFAEGGITKWQFYNDGSSADRFEFENATGRVFLVDQNGNIVIGDDDISPNAQLHLVNDQDDLTEFRIDNNNSGTNIDHTGLGLYDDTTLEGYFRNNNNSHLLTIGQNNGVGEIAFETGGGTEVLRIDSSGNLGIGDTTPDYKLDVAGIGNFEDHVRTSYFVATSTTATSTFAGGLAIETSGFVYDYSTNNVGIGTASPNYTLDVSGDAAFSGDIYQNGALLKNASTSIDVFLIAGQSNAEGRGNSASSPTPATGTAFQYYGSSISASTDPVGGADTGSAWPQFAITYYEKTGRKIAFVPTAVGGSAMVAASDPTNTWDTSGALYDNSVNEINAALTAFTDAGYSPTFRGILWSQGEKDARKINDATITANDYKTAFQTMATNYRAEYRASLPIYIFKTGTRTDESDSGFKGIRDTQEEIAREDQYTYIVFRNAVDFPSRGLLDDTVHYTQSGYNEMGRIGAENIETRKSFAIWNEQSTSVAYNGLGNIGIGTTTPTYKFDVVGDGRFTGLLDASHFVATSTTADTNLHNTLYVDSSAGRVGIGTSSPLYKLSVGDETTGSDSYIGIGASGTNSKGLLFRRNGTQDASIIVNDAEDFVITYGEDDLGDSFIIRKGSAGANVARFDSNGYFGIGDITPASLFTVGDGDLFQVNSSGAIAAATGITSSGTINFSGLTASRLVVTNGSKNLTSSISSSNLRASITDESGTGVAIFGTSPNFTTSVTTSSATFSAFNTNATTLNIGGAATALTLGATTGTLTLQNPTITSPAPTLSLFNTTPTTINFAGGATALNIGASTGTTTLAGGLVVDTNSVVVDRSTNNVGIGDTSPSALLTVGNGDLFQVNSSGAIAAATGITSSGTITFSGLSDGIIQSTNGVLSASSTISSTFIADDFLRNDGDDTTSGQLTATNFIANSASATSTFAGGLAIETSGFVYDYSTNNVGIGTASPSAKLDVSGVIEAGSAVQGEFLIRNQSQLGGSDRSVSLGVASYNTLSESNGNYAPLLQGRSNNLGSFAYYFGYKGLYASTTVSTVASDLLNGTNAPLFLGLNSDGSSYFNAGNVGIGDISPSALLTVGNGDLFQVNSSGAIAAATGVTSSGTITFSGLSNGIIQSTSGVLSASSTISSNFIEDDFLRNDGDDTTSGQLTAANFVASSASATSTFAGGLAVDTNVLFVNPYTNQVGINDSSPNSAAALDVNGDIRVQGNDIYGSGGTGLILRKSTSASGGVRVAGFGGQGIESIGSDLSLGTDSFGTAITVVRATGKVGIGTTTPFEKLSVAGNAYIGGTLTSTSTVTGTNFVANSGSATSTFAGGLAIETSGFVYDYSTNNVGIGTASPNYTLDVSGSVRIDSGATTRFFYDTDKSDDKFYIQRAASSNETAITIQGTSVGIGSSGVGTGALYVDGNVGIGTTTPLSPLTVNGDVRFGEAANYDGFFYDATNGRLGLGTDSPVAALDVDATLVKFGDSSTSDFTLRFNQGGWDGGVYRGVIFENLKSNGNWEWKDGGSTQMTLNKDGNLWIEGNLSANGSGDSYITGNLGIGDTTPDYKLDVAGIGNFEDHVRTSYFVATSTTATSTFAGGLAIETSGFVYDYSTNNVGIGTASPTSKLHLYSNTSVPVILERDSSGGMELLFRNTSNEWSIGQQYDEVFRIQDETGGTDPFAIEPGTPSDTLYLDSSGNVGIGDTSPSALLTVGNGDLFQVNSSGAIAAATSITSSGTITFSGLSDGIIQSTNGVLSASSTISSTFIADDFLRNDGDDTTSGQLTATNFIANSASATSTFAGGLAIETSGFVYDYSTNNVGIGTASPEATLHVSGSDDAIFDLDVVIKGTNSDDPTLTFFDEANGSNAKTMLVQRGSGFQIQSRTGDTLAQFSGTNNIGGTISFYTDASTERLTIKESTGNVGIGTTTPSSKLAVLSTTEQLRLNYDATNYTSFTTNASGDLTIAPTGDQFIFQSATDATDGFQFLDADGGTPILNIDTTNERVGIGTTSPFAKLSVAGDVILDSNLITFASSTASSLVINYGVAATSTIKDGTAYSWTLATSTTASPLISIDTRGDVATTSIRGGLVLDEGSFVHDYGSGATSINNLEIGALSFDTNAGVVSWVDLPVSTTTASIAQSYTAQLDGNPAITIFGNTDGLGGIATTSVGIATTSPSAVFEVNGDVRFAEGANYNGFFFDATNARLGLGTSTPSAQLHTTGTVRFSNFGAGTLQTDASGNISVSSDERLKNITGSFEKGIEALKGITPISYQWNATSGLETASTYTGFSAQNVQKFIPEAIGVSPNGLLTLSDRPILAAVVNAIKEQQLTLDEIITTSETLTTLTSGETMWTRIATLVNNFVNGVLTIAGLRTDELCVGEVCVDEATFLKIVEQASDSEEGSAPEDPVEDPAPEEEPDGGSEEPAPEDPVVEEPVEEEPVVEEPAEEGSAPEDPVEDPAPEEEPDGGSEEPAPEDPVVEEPVEEEPVVEEPAEEGSAPEDPVEDPAPEEEPAP